MKTLKAIFFMSLLTVALSSCTAESLDDDEQLLNNNDTELQATGGVVDEDSGLGGD